MYCFAWFYSHFFTEEDGDDDSSDFLDFSLTHKQSVDSLFCEVVSTDSVWLLVSSGI